MSNPAIVQLADDVAALVTAATELGLRAERANLPTIRLDRLRPGEFHVRVIPKGESFTRNSRSTHLVERSLLVGLRAKMPPLSDVTADDSRRLAIDDPDQAAVDAFLARQEGLKALLLSTPGIGDQALVSVEADPLFDVDEARTDRVLTAVLTVTFQATERLGGA